MSYIVIHINSDLDPISYPIDTESQVSAARVALRDAGLAYAEVYAGAVDCPDSYLTADKLFAADSAEDCANG